MQAGLADVKLEEIICGGAPNFLNFLTTELRDFIGSKYNISDDSTYIGDSMGGYLEFILFLINQILLKDM